MIDLRNRFNVELPRCRGAYLEECPPSVWDDKDKVLEPKYDGERVSLQIGTLASLIVGRNRQDFLKGVARAKEFQNRNEINRDLAAIACTKLEDTVLDGELTDLRKLDGTQTKDTITRKQEKMFIGYVVWSCLFWKGKDVRNQPDGVRRDMAKEAIRYLKKVCKIKYPIKLIERHPATIKNLNKYLDAGWEGVIVKDKTKPIPQNKHGEYQRTNTWWWKVKSESRRTVDAFIIGVTEGASGGSGVKDIARKPNGKAATFDMAMKDENGNNIIVAKMFNLPKEAIEEGWKKFDKFRNRVAEFIISGWDGRAFRWPRFVRFRPDKSPEDCIFSEQIGKKYE